MILELKDLCVGYGNVQVVKGISLGVETSSFVTIIGANGAGKSTTLKAISGLVHPASGEIWFAGERIDRLSSPKIVQRGIGHVPEGRQLFSQMSVLDNIELGAFLRKDREGIRRDLQAVFEYFPILNKRQRQLAGSLSGGEQQMLAMGRALMGKPKVLLMDEPSLGLAPIIVQQIAGIITNLNSSGLTILLVEQNAKMALRVAKKGYVLETGKIVIQDDTKKLLNDESVIKAYLGA